MGESAKKAAETKTVVLYLTGAGSYLSAGGSKKYHKGVRYNVEEAEGARLLKTGLFSEKE